jgi:hypothetical protein
VGRRGVGLAQLPPQWGLTPRSSGLFLHSFTWPFTPRAGVFSKPYLTAIRYGSWPHGCPLRSYWRQVGRIASNHESVCSSPSFNSDALSARTLTLTSGHTVGFINAKGPGPVGIWIAKWVLLPLIVLVLLGMSIFMSLERRKCIGICASGGYEFSYYVPGGRRSTQQESICVCSDHGSLKQMPIK